MHTSTSFVYFSLLCLTLTALGTIGCDQVPDPGESKLRTHPVVLDETTTASTREFGHPLRETASADGSVPTLDRQNSPEGKRYAILESLSQHSESEEIVRYSGLAEYDVRKVARAEYNPQKYENHTQTPAAHTPTSTPKISPALQRAMSDASDIERFNVLVRIYDSESEFLSTKMDRAIALGEVTTVESYRAKRRDLVSQRSEHLLHEMLPLIEYIETIGGDVTYRCKNHPCLNLFVNKLQIDQIADLDLIELLGLDGPIESNADVTGETILAGAQLNQFIDSGFDGIADGDELRVAVFELEPFNDEHVGFRENSGTTTRIAGKYSCLDVSGVATDCTSTSNFPAPGSGQLHATSVAGVVLGDLRDGQDSTITTTSARIARSGYAGETEVYMYRTSPLIAASRKALDHVVGLDPAPEIAVSTSTAVNDTNCLGETDWSRDVNDLFEDGILLFQSAGNVESISSSNCSVEEPASAIGAFTVGAHGDSWFGDEDDVRGAPIWDNTGTMGSASPYGGVSSGDGKNRTIIDLTAYNCRRLLFDLSGGYSHDSCGTSYSAPTVAAAALDYMDFHISEVSSVWITAPGGLFTAMLLMGDRQGSAGKLNEEFSNRWGAGRLQMRKFNAPGMDVPWDFGIGSVCVEDEEVVTIPINGGSALSADVETFKAVIFWYDNRHESSSTLDDIDLSLKRTNDVGLRNSDHLDDNKERVFHDDVGGESLKLEIYGYDVTADNTGCGTNSMKVYYAWFYEDSDRDDGDGPSASAVYPE